MPERVRRPLPAAAPSDPLIAVETEGVPPGMIAEGTSFPIAAGTWLTARHVANSSCRRLIMVINGRKLAAQIAYLHPQSDLALLKTQGATGPALPLESADVIESETGYSFGFPQQKLGATQDRLMGRSRMQLNGMLGGIGPILSWAEAARFPDTLPALSGMSGGPMLDESGRVVGILVAASVRRGRVHTVAPEILQATEKSFALDTASASATPAREVTGDDVSLSNAASALRQEGRIVETYCLPAG
jgi:S1-C subfamily serine protease